MKLTEGQMELIRETARELRYLSRAGREVLADFPDDVEQLRIYAQYARDVAACLQHNLCTYLDDIELEEKEDE